MSPGVDRKLRSARCQTSGSNGDLGSRVERLFKSFEFSDGRGSVSISKELPASSRGLHAVTNGGSLACAGRQTKESDGRDALRILMNETGGLVETAVIYHDHFERACPYAHVQ